MLWAIVWLLLVAVMWGLFMSRISESPLSNRPVLSGLIVGFSGFCLLSTCLPVFAVLASTSWNVLTDALWEGGVNPSDRTTEQSYLSRNRAVD